VDSDTVLEGDDLRRMIRGSLCNRAARLFRGAMGGVSRADIEGYLVVWTEEAWRSGRITEPSDLHELFGQEQSSTGPAYNASMPHH